VVISQPDELRALLARTRTIAMVGASNDPLRPSYGVFAYLRASGAYDVVPVNPAIAELDGVRAYPSLAAYAAERGAPDLVDVFRRPSHAAAAAAEAIAAGAKAIWFQLGVATPEAIRAASEAGLDVVADRCIKVDHAALAGGRGA
jgi:uncharacterized protein